MSVVKEFNVTTVGNPYFLTFSICFSRFTKPFLTASKFGLEKSCFSTPPLNFKLLIVATKTTASGFNPDIRHFISKNFSAPKSAPNPASVTATSDNFKARFVACTLLQPWAILAKGPPCIIAGVCSKVCAKFGFIASFNNTAIAPLAFKSLAVTGSPSILYPTIILPRRSFKSCKSFDKHNIAIISDATVIINPSSRGTPFIFPPRPTVIFLRALSFISKVLFQVIFLVSILRLFPWCIWLSNIALSKLLAVVIACKSPVKCKFISSIGTTCEYPPPAAPPFIPIQGPRDGSLRATTDLTPILLSAWERPIVVVVFPSPAGVGFIAVTNTNLPFSLDFNLS